MKRKIPGNQFFSILRQLAMVGMAVYLQGCITSKSEPEKQIETPEEYKLNFSPPVLDFGDINPENEPSAKTISLSNSGAFTLSWSLSGIPDYLGVSQHEGLIAPREQTTLAVSLNYDALEIGESSDTLTLRYSGEAKEQIVISYSIIKIHDVTLSRSQFRFGFVDTTYSLTIKNTGNVNLELGFNCDSNLLNVIYETDSLAPGDSTEISVSSLLANLEVDSLKTGIQVTANNFRMDSIHTILLTHVALNSPLNYIVTDAEFDRNFNRLVTISQSDTALHIHTFPGNQIETIKLNHLPWSVSIAPDGSRAIVGHDHSITLVDLNEKIVIANYLTSTTAFDILLTSNSWVYILPRSGQHPNIYCYDIENQRESLSNGFADAGGTLRLAQEEKYIYVSDAVASPRDVVKYSIENGTAVLYYDSPYHGAPMTGNLFWISDDEQYLFSYTSNFFEISVDPEKDFFFTGSLEVPTYTWLDYSTAAGHLFTTQSSPPAIKTMEIQNFQLISTVPVSGYVRPEADSLVRSRLEPKFVFSEQNGECIHVLSRSPEIESIEESWFLQSFRLAELVAAKP